jgi:translocation and assembly module TamB
VAGDRLAFAFDAPRLADLAPLAPASLPHPLAGSIHATGTLALEPGGAGGDVDLKGDGVRIGADFAAQTIALQASFAPGGSANAATPRNARPLTLSAAATRIVVRQISLASARADIRGTLASHKATLVARGDAIDTAAELAGGFDDLQSAAQWRGQLLALTNRGDVPLTLTAPAALELGPAHARLANAHIVTADGRADVGDLEWNNGRVTTHGTFEGIPLASLATIAGRPLPMASTLKVSGDWSIAAAPRLTGAFAIRRQSGDLFGATPDSAPGVDVALGIDTLALSGTLHDDALDPLAFRSARSGNAQGTLSLGAVAGAPPGRLAPDAPLAFTLDAELATLTPLQPWLGTAAVVNGSARIALSGHGTFAAPVFSGTVAGDALRIDAPQYGVYLRDGRVRAHLADGGIAVDEISIAGGAGRFTASGTIAARHGNASTRRTEIAWHAEDFRVANRPDLRLVVAGAGTLAVQEEARDRRNVNVVEGKIEYDPAPPGQLGADVVVVGRTTRAEQRGRLPIFADANVDVDFGHNLTFKGFGLTTSPKEASASPRPRRAPQRPRHDHRGARHYFAFGQSHDRPRQASSSMERSTTRRSTSSRCAESGRRSGSRSDWHGEGPAAHHVNPLVPENEALAGSSLAKARAGSRTDYAAPPPAPAFLGGGASRSSPKQRKPWGSTTSRCAVAASAVAAAVPPARQARSSCSASASAIA